MEVICVYMQKIILEEDNEGWKIKNVDLLQRSLIVTTVLVSGRLIMQLRF